MKFCSNIWVSDQSIKFWHHGPIRAFAIDILVNWPPPQKPQYTMGSWGYLQAQLQM
jgi:hypothetical protein